jgi:hypothetical protein
MSFSLLPSTVNSGVTFQSLAKSQLRQVGRDDALSYQLSGPVDSAYLSKTKSAHAPDLENESIRPFISEYVDVGPEGGLPAVWTDNSVKLRFKWGKEGMTLAEASRASIQLVCEWPSLFSVLSATGLDPVTTPGSQRFGTKYADWLGKKIQIP